MPIHSTIEIARRLLDQSGAWLFFVQVELKNPGGQFARLVRNPVPLAANGVVWQAASIAVEAPGQEAEGGLAESALSVPNASRLPMSFIEPVDRLKGQTVTWWLAHSAHLADFSGGRTLTGSFRVRRVTASAGAFVLRGAHAIVGRRVPQGVMTREDFPGLLPAGAAGVTAP